MIPKIIQSTSYDFDQAAVSLVPLHRRGIDSGWMKKHANFGSFGGMLGGLAPIPGKTVIHVLAVGDEEAFGPNRNCDGFSEEDNRTCHKSFKDIGHVFQNHKNDDPEKAVGDVLMTAHNDLMKRIELVLALDNNKCSKEVNALESGKDVPLSMGSMQDFDVCSYCKNKAPTADDHCDHIKNMLGLVAKNGVKIYMKNPKPKYFDISLVFKPADRIAYTLRKVAADNGRVLGGHELAEMVGLRTWTDPKTAALKVMASIYKEIPATARKLKPGDLKDSTVRELKTAAARHGVDQVIGWLHTNGLLLSDVDFVKVAVNHKPTDTPDLDPEDDPSIEDLAEDATDVKSVDGADEDDQRDIGLSDEAKCNLRDQCGMNGGSVAGRTLKVLLVPTRTVKLSSDMDVNRGLKLLYSHYKLAFATRNINRRELLVGLTTTF